MRSTVSGVLSVGVIVAALCGPHPAAARQKADPAKPTAAAEKTQKLLQVKVTGNFTGVRLGDVLKEFAAQVEMNAEGEINWAYGEKFPHAQKVTYTCEDKPLADALNELFKKNGGLGYTVVSKEGDRRDGWVMVTAK